MADFSDSPRKTLDDIRRELDADYPVALETGAPVLVAGDDSAAAVERSSSRRRAQARRYVTIAALGGVGVLLLVMVASVVLALKPMRPHALAVARESAAPRAVVAGPDRDARDARPVAAMASPAIPSELARELKALRRDLKALADRLDRSDSRVAGMESRVQAMESSQRRFARDATPATRPSERTVAAPPATAKPSAPVVAVPVVESAARTASPTAPDPRPVIAVTAPAPASPTPPQDGRPAVEVVVSPEPRIPAPSTSDVSESRPPGAEPSEPVTFRQKLRAEWRTIRQGFAGAGEDFKAILGFGRKAAGE